MNIWLFFGVILVAIVSLLLGAFFGKSAAEEAWKWRIDLALQTIRDYELFWASRKPCTFCGKHRYENSDVKDFPVMTTEKYMELLENDLSRKKKPTTIETVVG